jgi:hypothetical protein
MLSPMKAGYRIKPLKHPRFKWVVRAKESGKWVRRYFVKKTDDAVKFWAIEPEKGGENVVAFEPAAA